MNNYEIMMNGNVKIGEYAPDFEAITTMGNIKFSDYRGKWVVLFSHPGDFTPVCTTEMIAFSKANTYFEKLNTCLIGLSVDSNRKVNITVPTKTSDLTNDSSFVTQTTLNTAIATTKSKTVPATLLASNWRGTSAPCTYILAVTGVTASSNGSLRIAQSATDEQFTAWGAAQPRVTAQADETLTVKATGTVPTIDIPVEVLIV